MAEPTANVGLEQQMPELPGIKQAEVKVEGGDLQNSLEKNHADKWSSQLHVEADLTGNSESVETSAEHNLAEKSDKTDGIPLEKETDDILFEKKTDEEVLVPRNSNSESVQASAEHNLSEKSDKADDTQDTVPMTGNSDSVETSGEHNLADKANDTQVTVPMTGKSESVQASAEHNLAETSDKADDIQVTVPLTGNTESVKTSAGHNLAKKSDKAGDIQVIVQMAGKSESVEISAEHDLAEKPDKDDDTPLKKETNGTTLEKETDDTPLEKQMDDQITAPMTQMETGSDQRGTNNVKTGEEKAVATSLENKTGSAETNVKGPHPNDNHTITPLKEENGGGQHSTPIEGSNQSFTFEAYLDGDDSGSEEEQAAFMKVLENFYRERSMEFKPPKFYGEPVNCLKLWRAVTRFGGYDQVTACKLWRQVGESFKPPKTCTTVSWTFRNFFEKALLEYEKHKIQTGELKFSMVNLQGFTSVDNQVGGNQASGSGRARRGAAARAMQGWHTQGLLDSEEDKNLPTFLGKDKQLKSVGASKKRKTPNIEHGVKVPKTDSFKPQGITIVDAGAPADWVKINVQRTDECYEVYALVPGLLREEVQVQSDPTGRLIISGEPEQPDNPWGVSPFKKVITLPSRINPHQTSAVVTLHGQLFVRAPIDQSDV